MSWIGVLSASMFSVGLIGWLLNNRMNIHRDAWNMHWKVITGLRLRIENLEREQSSTVCNEKESKDA